MILGIKLMSKCNNIHIILSKSQLHDICATETIFEKSHRNFLIFSRGKKVPREKIPIWQNGKKFPWEKFPTGKNKY